MDVYDHWTIRNATEDDIPSVLGLWAAAGSLPSVTDSPDGLDHLLAAGPQALLVAELDGVLAGSFDRRVGRLAWELLPVGGLARASAQGTRNDAAQRGRAAPARAGRGQTYRDRRRRRGGRDGPHVPGEHFETFWEKVGRIVGAEGRVFFIDSLRSRQASAAKQPIDARSGVLNGQQWAAARSRRLEEDSRKTAAGPGNPLAYRLSEEVPPPGVEPGSTA